eukprot:m.230080 g.230080  ORF g.230080 m.230080 type:complete len:271 (+) comp17057_c3_seq1:409-1221(+)
MRPSSLSTSSSSGSSSGTSTIHSIHHHSVATSKRGKAPTAWWVILGVTLTGVLLTGLYLSVNHEVALQLLIWLEDSPLHLRLVAFFLLYIIASLPMMVGIIALNIAAGYLFGFWLGCIISMSAASFGAIVVTWTCRLCCLATVQDLQAKHERLSSLIQVLEGPAGFKIVAMLRMTFIPFGIQNALFASAMLSTPAYGLATALGVAPLVIMNSFMGSSFKNMEEVLTGQSRHAQLVVLQVIAAVVLTVAVSMVTKRELGKIKSMPTTADMA